jgi:hypothetical protein
MKPAKAKMDREAFWKLPRPTVAHEAVKEALGWVKGEYGWS